MFSIIQQLFRQKDKPLYPRDLNLGSKEFDIKPSCVRSPWFLSFPRLYHLILGTYLELIVLTRVNFFFVPYGHYYEIALV